VWERLETVSGLAACWLGMGRSKWPHVRLHVCSCCSHPPAPHPELQALPDEEDARQENSGSHNSHSSHNSRRDRWVTVSLQAEDAVVVRKSAAQSAHETFGHGDGLFHKEAFLKKIAESGTRGQNEVSFYRAVEEARQASCVSKDALTAAVSRFYGLVSLAQRDGTAARYMRLSNLLMGVVNPRTMDIKMGVRCFEEEELRNPKPRGDLYQRMAQMEGRLPAPVLTAEEHSAQAISKARWMQLRDNLSSTTSHGFRIDAVRTPDGHWTAFDSDLCCIRTDDLLLKTFHAYLPPTEECDVGVTAPALAASLAAQLHDLGRALRSSPLFSAYEFVGSSIFFVVDTAGTLTMIDFGVTKPVPPPGLRHDVRWELGSREDGYLIGLDSLTALWVRLAGNADADEAERPWMADVVDSKHAC
jgi:hypothetical protein